MRVTNNLNLPEPFVRAVTADSYEKGDCDYSVSELLAPPRQRQLQKRHDADLTEDASSRLWALIGSVAHDILERAGKEGQELTEKRLYATVGGKRVGGKLDTLSLSSGLLTDYKVTSVWSYILDSGRDAGSNKPEWSRQLNAYAFLAQENGYTVNSIEIFAMFRDFSQSRSDRESDYPKNSCMRIPVRLWEKDETQLYLAERVRDHEAASRASDEELAPCTAEERWARPTTYAVMKPGRKSALSVHESEASAVKAMQLGQTIETRPGKSVRCEGYCSAASKCSQWAADPANVKEGVCV